MTNDAAEVPNSLSRVSSCDHPALGSNQQQKCTPRGEIEIRKEKRNGERRRKICPNILLGRDDDDGDYQN
jgi:hypothetical protein